MQAARQHSGPWTHFPRHTPDYEPNRPISNRYNKLLEFPVTDTKQTTDPLSNRYKNALLSRRFSSSFRPPARLGGPLLGMDRTERRPSHRAVQARPPQRLCPRRQASATSNRYNKLLESPVTHTEHRIGPVLIGARITFSRHSFTLRNEGSLATAFPPVAVAWKCFLGYLATGTKAAPPSCHA